MTPPDPSRLARYADNLVAKAKDLVAAPDDLEARTGYARAAFNLDRTAAAICDLAASQADLMAALKLFVDFEARYDADQSVREAEVSEARDQALVAIARATGMAA